MSKKHTEGSPLVEIILDQYAMKGANAAGAAIKQIADSVDNLVSATNFVTRVMDQPAGSVHPANSQVVTGTTAWVDITGAVLTFNRPTDTTYQIVGDVIGKCTGTPGEFVFTAINVDGVRHNLTDGGEGLHDNLNPGYTTSWVTTTLTLAGGTTHTIKLQCSPDNVALSFGIFDSDLYCYELGR